MIDSLSTETLIVLMSGCIAISGFLLGFFLRDVCEIIREFLRKHWR